MSQKLFNYKDLKDDFKERTAKIDALQGQQSALLAIDEKGKLVIISENKERAMQLGKTITELRHRNEEDAALLARIEEICARNNIDPNDIHRLPRLIPDLEKHIESLETAIKEYQKTGLDKQKASPFSPYYQKEQMLKQAQQALKNYINAGQEIVDIMEEKK